MEINESPIYLLLDATINPAGKDLPISIFESGVGGWVGEREGGGVCMLPVAICLAAPLWLVSLLGASLL